MVMMRISVAVRRCPQGLENVSLRNAEWGSVWILRPRNKQDLSQRRRQDHGDGSLNGASKFRVLPVCPVETISLKIIV